MEYRQLLVSIAGMTTQQAFDYNMQNIHFVDYGYTPIWYITEEISCLNNYSIFKVCHKFDGRLVNGI